MDLYPSTKAPMSSSSQDDNSRPKSTGKTATPAVTGLKLPVSSQNERFSSSQKPKDNPQSAEAALDSIRALSASLPTTFPPAPPAATEPALPSSTTSTSRSRTKRTATVATRKGVAAKRKRPFQATAGAEPDLPSVDDNVEEEDDDDDWMPLAGRSKKARGRDSRAENGSQEYDPDWLSF